MATEQALQEGIQASIRNIARFSSADVQINNDTFLDGPIANSPFVNILNADTFNIRMDTITPTGTYEFPVILYREWTDWQTTYDDFRADRQAIVDEFNTVGTARSCGGLDGVTINDIRSEGPITAVAYDETAPALPVYIMQSLIFSVELF